VEDGREGRVREGGENVGVQTTPVEVNENEV